MSAGLHFISTIGEVSDINFVGIRDRIANDNPGSLPDFIDRRELFAEIQKNRGFMNGVVILSDNKNVKHAETVADAVKKMGVAKVRVVQCL